VTERRGRRRRKLLDDLKERRGYCHLKEEALDRTMWRTCFGRGFGPVVRQSIEENECNYFSDTLPLSSSTCGLTFLRYLIDTYKLILDLLNVSTKSIFKREI
jgi:hypothetical protein